MEERSLRGDPFSGQNAAYRPAWYVIFPFILNSTPRRGQCAAYSCPQGTDQPGISFFYFFWKVLPEGGSMQPIHARRVQIPEWELFIGPHVGIGGLKIALPAAQHLLQHHVLPLVVHNRQIPGKPG